MRDYAKISPQFWIGNTGRQIRKLGLASQLLALYLLTCPNATMIGVYYLPVAFIEHETGLPLEAATKALRSLCEVAFCTYDDEMEYIWVHEMAFYQVGGQLKPGDNRVKGINDDYQSLPNLSFLKQFFDKYQTLFYLENPRANRASLQDPSQHLSSQEQDQEQDQDQKQEKKIFMFGKLDAVPPPSEPAAISSVAAEQPSTTLLKKQAVEILQFLNEKTGRAYRPVDTNLKLIMARLKSGASVMDCRQIIAKKTREWKNDTKMAEYLRPATLFNATKFEQYLGELVLPQEHLP